MASYVEDALIPGEVLVHQGRVSLWSLGWLLLFGILLLPVFGLGLIFLVWALILYKTTELAITTKRIISKSGFIRRETIEINLAKIESLRVEQSIMGRMLNYGTIIVSGTGSHNAPVPNISNPMEFRRKFMEATDALQNRAT